MIRYCNTLTNVTEDMLEGFFVGWPNPPSRRAHVKLLNGSYCFWLAIDEPKQKVIGFVTAISDGILSAYIPLLEVLPTYQNRGIGKELVQRILGSLSHLYMIDLLCDNELRGYYNQFGMNNATGVCIRNYQHQSGESLG